MEQVKKEKLARIALIDDDDVFQFLFRKLINKAGIEAELMPYQDCGIALKLIEDAASGKISHDEVPDLIFLDINMPGLTGWEFMERFHQLQPRLKKRILIFMLSTSVFSEDENKAESDDLVEGYLIKPITVETLQEIRKNYFS